VKMTIYDITLTVSPDMPVWPGDPAVSLQRAKKIEEGANANVSHLSLSVHTGTHVDAPFHFLPGGKGVDQLALDVLIGPVQVVALAESVDEINAATIQQAGIEPGSERVIFKTRNSHYWADHEQSFQAGFVGISQDGARALVGMGVKLVGIDYLSVAPFKRSRPTHEVLLSAGMIIVEGLDLSLVPPGQYQLYCLPTRLSGADGAPARAILMTVANT
jgi:arylformamidase